MVLEQDNPVSVKPELAPQAEVVARMTGALERRKKVEPEDARRILHDLRVHQCELEAQNEELRRTQAELEATRSRYFDLYDLAPVGYCTVSVTHHILEGNLTAASLLGSSRSELVGKSIRSFIAAADQDIYYRHCQSLLETEQSQSCELRMVKKDGSVFWAQMTSTQTPGHTSQISSRLVLTDINERKVAQERSRISELALKAINQGVFITTPELRVVSVNEAFLSMTGYTEHELVGVNWSLFSGPLTDPVTTAKLLKLIKERRGFSGEMVNYRKDGSSFWNQLDVSPVFDDGGQLTHFISVNTDVSERMRLDQLLVEKNLSLQQASLKAEKASLAKSNFISSMSHELRSPLNAILGFAQLLETGTPALTPAQQVKTEKIQRGGWYLLSLINDILDLALIESGKLSLSLTPISVEKVLHECQSMIELQAERYGIRVNFPQVASQFMVRADAVRLQQVIINLLSNAIKYNRSGGTVSVTVAAASADVLRISVQDTGEGMSEDKLSQLFEPFNRLGREGGTTQGTGIGLVVTQRLTELMGGLIGVQSTVGVGSVFWIELSLAQTQPDLNSDLIGPEGLPPVQPLSNQKPCTVLYVEDNHANMELVEQILAIGRPSIHLLRAENGEQGIEMARIHAPQVILMDINLPGINGLMALRVLREDPATCHIPVLAISANAMPSDIAKGIVEGFDRYLVKPFKVKDFLSALDLALQQNCISST